MAEADFVSLAGEEVVEAMIQQTLEPWPVLISVHRDIICWMSNFVSPLDFNVGVPISTVTQIADSMHCAYTYQ